MGLVFWPASKLPAYPSNLQHYCDVHDCSLPQDCERDDDKDSLPNLLSHFVMFRFLHLYLRGLHVTGHRQVYADALAVYLVSTIRNFRMNFQKKKMKITFFFTLFFHLSWCLVDQYCVLKRKILKLTQVSS